MANENSQTGIMTILSKAKGAFLGVAVGDALGWPNENRWHKKSLERDPLWRSFQKWVRVSGGKFFAHEEVILPGEYSDDTQLMLCTARSVIHGRSWYQHLTNRELPLWTLYERGGGSATKRAANSWLAGRPPWSTECKAEDRRSYFEAGGNGVAMRIMPHSLAWAMNESFANISHDILSNGVATHGNPRALVGALAYGFAVWQIFRRKEILAYGELIDLMVSGQGNWAALVPIEDDCPGWRRAAEEWSGGRYDELWKNTVAELVRMIEVSQGGLSQGALAVDRSILEKLCCFNHKISGAGTIAAAATIFLASRYAADPINGLMEAAFAIGADTDTLASMTACLLGALHGYEWLKEYTDRVQDTGYLQKAAERLTKFQPESDGLDRQPTPPITKADLEAVFLKLEKSRVSERILLPDGTEAEVSGQLPLKTRSDKVNVVSWRLTTSEGQTLQLKKISRQPIIKGQAEGDVPNEQSIVQRSQTVSPNITKVALRLPVANLPQSRAFYSQVLGLKIIEETPHVVTLQGHIDLVRLEYLQNIARTTITPEKQSLKRTSIIYLEADNLDSLFSKVQKSGVRIIDKITPCNNRRFFRFYDPDGSIVEVFGA